MGNIDTVLRAAIALGAAWFAGHAAAADTAGIFCDPATACEFQFYIENDILSGTDRYYTNGIKIGGGLNLGSFVDRVFQAPAEQVLIGITDKPENVQVGLFIGQNIYTPKDISVAAPQPFDRPWAAWLYIGGVAQTVSGHRLQTVEFDLGVVGPAAFGKEVQTLVHELTDSTHPKGWSNQLKNEPGVVLAYLEKRRFGETSGVQLIPHYGGSVGNVMTLARAGAVVRAGRHMSGFGPDTIEPGGAMLERVRALDAPPPESGREWYVFTGVDARIVAYNVFLDGNLFRSSPSVDRRAFVYDVKAGFSVRIASARVSLTQVWRSEEFRTPFGGGGTQRFQSLNLSWQF